jgi:hypothetical protein
MNLSFGRATLAHPGDFMTVHYTTYRLNKAGKIVESKPVTAAADVEAFEQARAAVIADREQMLAEACAAATAPVEDAA